MCKRALYISVFSCFLLLIKCNGDGYDADHDHCVESCNVDRHKDLDDHCYYWSTARQFWETSKQECEGMDGHLAAVTSLRIHNFLMKRVDKKDKDTWFWIGGSDKVKEDTWKWVDGSEWNYENWADEPHQQPSQPDWRHDCLQIYHGTYARNGWNDNNCDKYYPFICSWKICPGSLKP